MILRDETAGDIGAITDVTVAAFADHPVSEQTEQFIVKGLRDAGALALSLVAEIDGRIIGKLLFLRLLFLTAAKGGMGWGRFLCCRSCRSKALANRLLMKVCCV